MASEMKRGCGYRRVGGLYLCGEYAFVSCDRLPYKLESCPVCGAGIHFTRSMTKIDPLKLFDKHQEIVPATDNPHILAYKWACTCNEGCYLCDPTSEPAYIRTIGKKFYSPVSFMDEARKMGVSLRMNQIPKDLKLGKTVVYLAHPEAVYTEATLEEQKETGKMTLPRLGIFSAFIPQRVEMPVYDKMLKGKGSRKLKQSLKKRGITPVVVKGREHDPNYKPKKKK